MVSVSTFLWKNKPSNKRIISLYERKKRWSLFLIVSREYLTFTDTREGEKEYSRFQPTSKWLVSRRGRTQNVKLFPASHAQMIMWIFPESLRSPSPSPFSLLKVPNDCVREACAVGIDFLNKIWHKVSKVAYNPFLHASHPSDLRLTFANTVTVIHNKVSCCFHLVSVK